MGGGVKTALDNNWSAKFEALCVDLGGFDTAFGGVTNQVICSLGALSLLTHLNPG